MERRTFIHTLTSVVACGALTESALAGALSTAAPARLTEPLDDNRDSPRIGVVTEGGISRAILTELASSLPYLHRNIAIRPNATALQQVTVDQKIRLGHFLLPRDASQLARFQAKSMTAKIVDAVAGLDMVLLMVGLGDGAGSGTSSVVAQVLQEQNILTLGFTLSPFESEGEQFHTIVQSDSTHAFLAFIQLCRSITNSVATPDCITGIGFEDLRHLILGRPGRCAFGFGASSGVNGDRIAVDLALNHPFLGRGCLQTSSAALVAIEVPPHGLFLRETRDIMSQVRCQLPANADIIYSSVSTTSVDRFDFRVSILVSSDTI